MPSFVGLPDITATDPNPSGIVRIPPCTLRTQGSQKPSTQAISCIVAVPMHTYQMEHEIVVINEQSLADLCAHSAFDCQERTANTCHSPRLLGTRMFTRALKKGWANEPQGLWQTFTMHKKTQSQQ